MGFFKAFKEWFISNNYPMQAYNKLQDLKYTNNIEDLVVKYRHLATKAKKYPAQL